MWKQTKEDKQRAKEYRERVLPNSKPFTKIYTKTFTPEEWKKINVVIIDML